MGVASIVLSFDVSMNVYLIDASRASCAQLAELKAGYREALIVLAEQKTAGLCEFLD